MTKFTKRAVGELARIPIYPSRGNRKPVLPFHKAERGLRDALQRAERAYQRSCQTEDLVAHCLRLNSVFKEQSRLAGHCIHLLNAWKEMTDLAKKDLAKSIDYQLAVQEYGDDEVALATRPKEHLENLVARCDQLLTTITVAAKVNGQSHIIIKPSKKKDRLSEKSVAPLRDFAYELKLYWDVTISELLGSGAYKTLAFSTARIFVFEAMRLVSSEYSQLDVTRIIRSLQATNYDPGKSSESIPYDITTLALFRPALTYSPPRGKSKDWVDDMPQPRKAGRSASFSLPSRNSLR